MAGRLTSRRAVVTSKVTARRNFTHYNFVRNHRTIRCTPAMEAGIAPGALTVKDLVGDGRMIELVRLRQVIRDLHGLESEHVRSEPVHETLRGETVWDGTVEVFHVFGHPTATEAYAWAHETDAGGRRYVAVLALPPVRSAVDAVRASIAAEARGRR
jgi:hypothetical protein